MSIPAPIRVLLVEDNPFDAALVERELVAGGLSVHVTRAVTRDDFTAGLEDADVVLVDYNLPSFDPYTAMEIAESRGHAVPFIVVTGNVDEEIAVECIKRGAGDYVVKDRMARLPRAVLGVLEQEDLRRRQRAMEQSLRESEERFRSLVQNSRDVITVIDETGTCTYISPSVKALSGHDPEDVVGRSGFDFVHPEDRAGLVTHLADVVADPARTKTVEVRAATVTGGWIWIEARAANRLDDPAIRGIILNYHDVSERKESERVLRESRRLLADAEAVAHVGSFAWDVTGDAIVWSAEMFRIFGHEPGDVDLDYQSFLRRVHDEDRPVVAALVQDSLVSGTAFEGEYRIVRADACVRWIHVRGVPGVTDAGPRIVGTAQDVTERRAADEERTRLYRRQEALAEQLSLLLESTGEGIFGVDAEGRCTFVNGAALRMLGHDREEVMGTAMDELVHHTAAAPGPEGASALARAFRSGQASSRDDEVYRRRDGSSFPVEFSAHPIMREGRPSGAVVAFKDATHRQAMERELREREALFRGAFDAATTGIALSDAVTNAYVDVNEALCEIVGYPKDELLRLDWVTLTHPDDRARSIEDVENFKSGREQVTRVSKRYVRRDGRVIQVEINDALIRDERGAPLYFVSHVSDVTEREHAAKALRESQALLQEVIDNSPAAIYIKDTDGRYVLTNSRFAQIIGAHGDDLRGKTDHDLLPEDVAGTLSAMDREVLARGEPVEVEEIVPDATGRRGTYLSVKFPLFDEDGTPDALVAISTDISDRVRAEEEKAMLEAQLRQAQKMEAVGRLAGGVAHDFNNILAVILNYGDFVLEALPSDDASRADVEQIVDAGRRAAKLVHQLLAFSRHDAVEHGPVGLNEVVEGVREILARAIGEHISLEVDCAPGLWDVKADAGQLEQVLLNLAVNARDAMPDGGILTVATSSETLHERGGRGIAPGKYVKLTVADTGLGIDSATRERIFEPFFTTKPRGEGTGLGLSTVYGIVAQAHGQVFVESEPGAGTSFEVYLPATDERAPEEAPSPDKTSPAEVSGKILVVEDEDAVRELVARILRRSGFEVVAMPSAPVALDYCKSNLDDVDLLLTDVVMPGMSGTTLAERVAALGTGVKTLYMSGYTGDAIPGRDWQGIEGNVIGKPFTPEQLVSCVRAALACGAAS
ncbi:MAG TPA: PAS domain S-box protein [Actinomycetota bacterium]|nr:PAS domain S-box protein [Actinomycetota bacterium]